MHSRGLSVAVVAGAVFLSSCNAGLQIGQAPPTSIITTTTTALTTSTIAPPRRATTTTVRARIAPVVTTKHVSPTTTAPVEIDPKVLAVFDIVAADVRSLLLAPGTKWGSGSGADDSGPVDIDKAAANQALGDDEFAAELRSFLEDIGFLVGYDREWEKRPDPGSTPNDFSFLSVGLYLFSTPEGATANHEVMAAVLDEVALETTEPITVGDIPRSRAWMGGNADDGYFTFVQFAHENFFAQILFTSSTNKFRTDAVEAAKLQYEKLHGAMDKLTQKYRRPQ